MSDGLSTIVLPAASAGRDLPDRHHQRVVPGRHLADDPDRLAPHPGGVARHVLPRAQPVEHAGGAGEEPQLVDAGRHLVGGGQVQRLAGVPGLDGDELVGTLLDRVGEAQQRQLALGRRRAAPRGERVRRGGVGRVDVLRAPDSGARAYSCPVDGSITAVVRPSAAGRSTPPITLRSSIGSAVWLTGALLTVGAPHATPLGARTGALDGRIRPIGARRTPESEVHTACHDGFLALRPSAAPPSAGGHTQTGTRAPGARRRLQGDRRAAPGGRPATVRHHRQGDRAVRGRRAPARPAPHRLRRHADRRGDRPAAGRASPGRR